MVQGRREMNARVYGILHDVVAPVMHYMLGGEGAWLRAFRRLAVRPSQAPSWQDSWQLEALALNCRQCVFVVREAFELPFVQGGF